MMLLKRIKVIITGSTGGLGRTLSEYAIKNGYSVIGLSRGRHPDIDKKLEDFARKNKVSYKSLKADFSDPERLKTQLEKDTIIPDIKDISHALICHGANFNYPLPDLSWKTIEESMRVNFGGPFVLAQYLTNQWAKNTKPEDKNKPDRSLVYISTVAVKGASTDELAYHSAKNAMVSAMRSLVRKYTPCGIRFNVVSPGLMDTEMGRTTVLKRPDVLKRIPLGHLVSADEVAKGILYLLESPSITGVDLDINCGRYMSL